VSETEEFRTVALITKHDALREALSAAPSVYACYRFTTKLRERKPLLDACIARIVESLRAELPDYGIDLALDASDLPAYANGQRYVSNNGRQRERFSDPDASWGHRSAISTRRAVASTAFACMPLSAPGPIFRSLGASSRRARTNRVWPMIFSAGSASAWQRRPPRSTRATTWSPPTTPATASTSCRSSPSEQLRP